MRFSYQGLLEGHPVVGEVAEGKITGNPLVAIQVEALVRGGVRVGWGPVTGQASLTDPYVARSTIAAVLDQGTASFEGDQTPVDSRPAPDIAESELGLPSMGDGDGASLSPTRLLRAHIEEMVADDTPVTRRLRELEGLRAELEELYGDLARAERLIEVEDDSRPAHVRRDLLKLREGADLREELLTRRLFSPDELDNIGLVSHDVIDRYIDLGMLEEAIGGFLGKLSGPAKLAFASVHPRGRGGRWIDTPDKPTPPKRRPAAKRSAAVHAKPSKPVLREKPREPLAQKRGAAGGGPRFNRYQEVRDHPKIGTTVKGSTVKKVLRDADGNEQLVYETFDATAVEIVDAVNAGIDHPSLSFQARSALRERKQGTKKNVPGLRETKAGAKKRGLEKEAEGQTYEDERARGYEKRKAALDKRVAKEVTKGTSGEAITADDFNDAERTSQARLLRYAREASSTPTTAEENAQLDEDGNYVLDDGGNTVYDTDRAQLHEQIADLFLRKRRREPTGKRDDEGNEEYRYVLCPECGYMEGSEDPEVLFSGGGYSSGKGGVVDRIIATMDGTNTLVLDPDQIKALLPEFSETLEGDPEANLRTFEEAWAIAQAVQVRAQEMKLNVVVDGVSNGHADEMLARVDQFKNAGYARPRAIYVDIPTDEALDRAAKRAKKAKKASDRRHIPEPIMRAVHRDVAATIPGVIDGARERNLSVEVWDNNQGQAADGSFIPPKRFANFDPGKDGEFVEDQALWDRLRLKAEETIPGVEGELPPLPERVEALVTQARELGIDKWPPTKDKDALKVVPEGFFDTQEMYASEQNGQWSYSPERVAEVHDAIIEKLLEGHEPQEERRILYLTGGTATGKGTVLGVLEKAGEAPPGAVTLDPDKVKEMMPEWSALEGNPYGANALHRESSVITKKAWDLAKQRKLNLVIDKTGGGQPSGWLANELETQRKDGYQAEVVLVDIPVADAIERAMTRAVEQGRFVPLARLQQNHATVSSRIQELIDLDWLPLRMFTNAQRGFDLEQSLMAARGPDGKIDVKLPTAYDDWLKKASRVPDAAR